VWLLPGITLKFGACYRLTQLMRPVYPADVAPARRRVLRCCQRGQRHAERGVGAGAGADLFVIDLQSGTTRTLLAHQSEGESREMRAVWPDGRGILYQRSNLRDALPIPAQAQPQYRSCIGQVALDGTAAVVLIDDAR
jgi:hypothetical protein